MKTDKEISMPENVAEPKKRGRKKIIRDDNVPVPIKEKSPKPKGLQLKISQYHYILNTLKAIKSELKDIANVLRKLQIKKPGIVSVSPESIHSDSELTYAKFKSGIIFLKKVILGNSSSIAELQKELKIIRSILVEQQDKKPIETNTNFTIDLTNVPDSYRQGFNDGRRYVVITAESYAQKYFNKKSWEELVSSGNVPGFWLSTVVACLEDPKNIPVQQQKENKKGDKIEG
jgi:hypothetical protein